MKMMTRKRLIVIATSLKPEERERSRIAGSQFFISEKVHLRLSFGG